MINRPRLFFAGAHTNPILYGVLKLLTDADHRVEVVAWKLAELDIKLSELGAVILAKANGTDLEKIMAALGRYNNHIKVYLEKNYELHPGWWGASTR